MIPRNVEIRPFRPADLDPVVALADRTMLDDAAAFRSLALACLLDPGFRPDDLLVVEQGGRLAGFLLAPRLRPPARVDDPSRHGTQWIAAFGVHPDRRRQGIGAVMVQHALDAAARDGVQRIDVADFPVRYLVPGIDPETSAAAHALLVDRFGFCQRDRVASMIVVLDQVADPPADDRIRPMEMGEIPQVRGFLTQSFGWSWWQHIEQTLWAQWAGADVRGETLVAWDGDRPVGVVHHCGRRFGPLAVAEGAQGQGLGTRLTLAILARMADRALAYAYFLIADARAERFYNHLGFTVQRRFVRLTRTLTPP